MKNTATRQADRSARAGETRDEPEDARPAVRVATERVSLWNFAGPRYWGVWLGLTIARVSILLPLRAQLALGRAIGRLAYSIARRDRHIATVNVGICLPELSPAEQHALVKRHFESLGCAFLETALVWWGSERQLGRILRIEGMAHLDQALRAGRGAILLSAHFTTLEMGARALTRATPTAIMYQTPRNALIAEISLRRRRALAVRAIGSDSVRELLQSLKQNRTVWYAPDQREEGRSAAIVPFFGRPASTNIATSRIARISGAPVLPFFPERLGDGSGYVCRIGPPLEGFHSGDPLADAARFHAAIEAHVRRCPEQYLWVYKRFKLPGVEDPYRRSAP
jgi:Kdo2-lipid IVA lauroyltransferase/acyltransferase